MWTRHFSVPRSRHFRRHPLSVAHPPKTPMTPGRVSLIKANVHLRISDDQIRINNEEKYTKEERRGNTEERTKQTNNKTIGTRYSRIRPEIRIPYDDMMCVVAGALEKRRERDRCREMNGAVSMEKIEAFVVCELFMCNSIRYTLQHRC